MSRHHHSSRGGSSSSTSSSLPSALQSLAEAPELSLLTDEDEELEDVLNLEDDDAPTYTTLNSAPIATTGNSGTSANTSVNTSTSTSTSRARSPVTTDVTDAVAEVYTHLAKNLANNETTSSSITPTQPTSVSDEIKTWSKNINVTYATTTDPLSSPQPASIPAPKPHPLASSSSGVNLEQSFDRSKSKNEEESKQQLPPTTSNLSRSTTRITTTSSTNTYQSSPSQTHTSLHPSSRASLVASTVASSNVRILDSNVSRVQWMENKKFILTSLQRALQNKEEEIIQRIQGLSGDRLECEQKLLQTLEAYIRTTKKALTNYLDEMTILKERMKDTKEHVIMELERFDAKAIQGRSQHEEKTNDPAEDPQRFDLISTQLESEIQAIIASIQGHHNFSLDVNTIPSFDPFHVEKVKRLEREKAELECKIEKLTMNGIEIPSDTNSKSTILPYPSTQTFILSLQDQLADLHSRYSTLQTDFSRIQSDNTTLRQQLSSDHLTLEQKWKDDRWTAVNDHDQLAQKVTHLEASLRAEQQLRQELEQKLEQERHAAKTTQTAIAQERLVADANVKRYQNKEQEFLTNTQELREKNQTEFEKQRREIQALHHTLQQLQTKSEEERRVYEKLLQQDTHAALAQQKASFEKEKLELEKRVQDMTKEYHSFVQHHDLEMVKVKEEAKLKDSHAADELAKKDALYQVELRKKDAEVKQLTSDLEVSNRTLSSTQRQRDEDRLTSAHQLRGLQEKLVSETSALQECKKQFDQLTHEHKYQASVLNDLRSTELAIKMEVEELRMTKKTLSEKLGQTSMRYDELKFNTEQKAAKKLEEEAALQLEKQALADLKVKQHAREMELELLKKQSRDTAQQSELQRIQLEKQFAQEHERAEDLVTELERERRASQSQYAQLELQYIASQAALDAAKKKTQQLMDDHELTILKYAQMQQDHSESAEYEVSKVRATIDAQVEIQLSRFSLGLKDRLERIVKMLKERNAAGTGNAEDPSLDELRHALNPLSNSACPILDPYPHLFPTASTMTPLAAVSLPSSKLQLESLFSQFELLQQQSHQLAHQQRQRLSERYAEMINKLKKSMKEEVKTIRDSVELQRQKEKEEFEMKIHELCTENEELTSQLNGHDAHLQRTVEKTVTDYERLMEEERATMEERFKQVIKECKEEHEHDYEQWKQEKAQMLQEQQQRVQELSEEKEELTDHSKGQLDHLKQELTRCQQELSQVHELHRNEIAKLQQQHQDSLNENTSLLKRKSEMDKEVLQSQHEIILTKLKHEYQLQQDEIERRFMKQLQDAKMEQDSVITYTTTQAIKQRDDSDEAHQQAIRAMHLKFEQEQQQLIRQHHEEVEEIIRQQQEQQRRTMLSLKSVLVEGGPSSNEINDAEFDIEQSIAQQMALAQGRPYQPPPSAAQHQQQQQRSQQNAQSIADHGLHSNRSTQSDISSASGSTNSSSTTAPLSSSQPRVRFAKHPTFHPATLPEEEDLFALQTSVTEAARSKKEYVKNLELQLKQVEQDKEELVAEMQERLERDTSDLRAAHDIAVARLEECANELDHTKAYCDHLTTRWQTLSQEFDELTMKYGEAQAQHEQLEAAFDSNMEGLQNQYQAQLHDLKKELVHAEHKLQQLLDEKLSQRDDFQDEMTRLKETHEKERQQWEEQLANVKKDVRQECENEFGALKSKDSQELLQFRRQLEETHTQQQQQLQQKYDALYTQQDSTVREQQATIQRLELSERALQKTVEEHETRLQELHEHHLKDLHQRLTVWRETRRRETEEEEQFLAMKMEAIKENVQKSQDILCKSCRQKLLGTSFRAGLNRLCDEATHPAKYRALHLPAPLEENFKAAIQTTVGMPLPTPFAQTVQPQMSLNSSARSVHFHSNTSPTTIAAKYIHGPSNSSSSARPPRPTAVGTTALSSGLSSTGASMLDAPSPPVFMPSPAIMSGIASSQRITRNELRTPLGSNTSSRSPTPVKPSEEQPTPSTAAALSTGPISRQEGVLTLRYHPSPASASSTVRSSTSTFNPMSTSSTRSHHLTPSPSATTRTAAPNTRSNVSTPSSATRQPTGSSSNTPTYHSMLDQYLNQYTSAGGQ